MYNLQLEGRRQRGLIRGDNLAKIILGKDFGGVKEEGRRLIKGAILKDKIMGNDLDG